MYNAFFWNFPFKDIFVLEHVCFALPYFSRQTLCMMICNFVLMRHRDENDPNLFRLVAPIEFIKGTTQRIDKTDCHRDQGCQAFVTDFFIVFSGTILVIFKFTEKFIGVELSVFFAFTRHKATSAAAIENSSLQPE